MFKSPLFHVCVRVSIPEIFRVRLELALRWVVSQWRGVSLRLDCCLTSQQTEHIGSGWTETLHWDRRAGKGGGEGRRRDRRTE